MTVVGLVANVKEDRSAFRRDRAVWYVPYAQVPQARPLYLLVRADDDATRLTAKLRQVIRTLDPNLPVSGVLRLDAYLGSLVRPDRFSAFVMVFFAGIGLTLAAVGLFGLLSYVARQRTREIGIRMALGAQPADILKMVVGEGMLLTGVGLLLGAAGALMAMRALSRFVYGAKPVEAVPLAGAAVVLVGVSLLACWLPARRAARLEPMAALRYE
jgi:ABC-type antimicrobial peptide transport system permease subunit